MKKILIGLALVAVLCLVGGAGYRFGQYLACMHASEEQADTAT